MVNNISSALNAYQAALSRIGAQTPVKESTPVQVTGSGSTFSDMVKSSIEEAQDLGKKSEQTTLAAIQGRASAQDVVLAVSNAELALDTVVAFRDTAIKAYQSIFNMQI